MSKRKESKTSTLAAKPYPRNPRTITAKRFARLSDTLDRLGDLSGIVHDLNTDAIIGGNQRAKVFGEATQVEIVSQLDAPDEQGTIAHGFIVWRGKRYAYRQVRWDEATAGEANIAANVGAGDWDWSELASWNTDELQSWGFDDSAISAWGNDYSNLKEMLAANDAVDFKEYDESAADDVVMLTCPHCGKTFPK